MICRFLDYVSSFIALVAHYIDFRISLACPFKATVSCACNRFLVCMWLVSNPFDKVSDLFVYVFRPRRSRYASRLFHLSTFFSNVSLQTSL